MTRGVGRWIEEPTGPIWVRGRDGDADGRFTATLSHDLLPGWEIVVTVDPAGMLDGLQFRAADPSREPLTARLLRRVPVGELHQRVLAERRRLADEYRDLVLPAIGAETFEDAFGGFMAAALRRPGRSGHGDLWYAVWAARYVGTNSRAPIKALAATWNEDPDYIRNVIDEARTRELLTRAGTGRAGGELTAKAIELLRTQEDTRGEH